MFLYITGYLLLVYVHQQWYILFQMNQTQSHLKLMNNNVNNNKNKTLVKCPSSNGYFSQHLKRFACNINKAILLRIHFTKRCCWSKRKAFFFLMKAVLSIKQITKYLHGAKTIKRMYFNNILYLVHLYFCKYYTSNIKCLQQFVMCRKQNLGTALNLYVLHNVCKHCYQWNVRNAIVKTCRILHRYGITHRRPKSTFLHVLNLIKLN